MSEKQSNFCHLCSERLHGTYYTYSNGLVVCERCQRTVPRCSRCGVPSKQLTPARGKMICPSCRQEAPVCALCHESILTRYIKYGKNLIVCEDCDQTVPHCSRCGVPSKQLTQARDGLICPACRKKAKTCSICDEVIVGQYHTYGDDLVVCEHCYKYSARCDWCNRPSKKQQLSEVKLLSPVREGRVCSECLKKAVVCGCCHKIFLGNSSTIGDSATQYCEDCMKTRPRCGVCQAPFLEAEGKIFSGREKTYRCPACFSMAVTTQKEAERLYGEIAGLLQQKLGLQIARLPSLYIVDRATLIEKRRQAATPTDPEPEHLGGFFQRINNDWKIYIEHLLPQARFQEVTAHELAHAWQATHAPEKQPAKITEGFAEWVAYQTLLALGRQREAAHMTALMTQRNDAYGEGLQYFLALERQQGRKGVLQRARQA